MLLNEIRFDRVFYHWYIIRILLFFNHIPMYDYSSGKEIFWFFAVIVGIAITVIFVSDFACLELAIGCESGGYAPNPTPTPPL